MKQIFAVLTATVALVSSSAAFADQTKTAVRVMKCESPYRLRFVDQANSSAALAAGSLSIKQEQFVLDGRQRLTLSARFESAETGEVVFSKSALSADDRAVVTAGTECASVLDIGKYVLQISVVPLK